MGAWVGDWIVACIVKGWEGSGKVSMDRQSEALELGGPRVMSADPVVALPLDALEIDKPCHAWTPRLGLAASRLQTTIYAAL
jgi:hypothetical protein